MRATVRQLNVYPLKSAGGIRLESGDVTPGGFRYDREFMLIRPDGAHLSQRGLARMALPRPSYDGRTLLVDAIDAMTPLVHQVPTGGAVRDVTLFGRPYQSVDQGDDAADWFSALLDADCRLVRFTGRRDTKRGGGTVAHADGYPFLVISAESLEDLNSRLEYPVPMNRFRPAIVIEGLGPYGEDSVNSLRVGDVEIEFVQPCGHCVITTTDQNPGVRGHETLRTLPPTAPGARTTAGAR